MAENFAWLVSLVADFAQIIAFYRSGKNSFPEHRWAFEEQKTALKYRSSKDGFKVSFKRTIKRY